MTVADLIDQLDGFPFDTEVYVESGVFGMKKRPALCAQPFTCTEIIDGVWTEVKAVVVL